MLGATATHHSRPSGSQLSMLGAAAHAALFGQNVHVKAFCDRVRAGPKLRYLMAFGPPRRRAWLRARSPRDVRWDLVGRPFRASLGG
eukprot:9264046-Pyramimonas_sp.AAC.1